MIKPAIAALMLGLFTATATAQHVADDAVPNGIPAIDPTLWRGEIAGPTSRILTIGSPHLRQIEPLPPRESLAPLIDRLVAFAPDIVTQEGVSGEQCEMMQRTPAIFGTGLDYCWDAATVAAATGMDGAAARTAIAATLAAWPADPTADQRRQLALLFIAAHDRTSALVQWWRLPEAERRATAQFPEALVAIIVEQANGMNERNSVAAAVAARRGLDRVYQVDDHSSDAILTGLSAECEAALNAHWQSPRGGAIRSAEAPMIQRLTSGEGMLAYYRHMNSPDTQRQYIDVDQRAAMNLPGAGDCGRRYVAWWEVRNLRMVANIRAAMGGQPGARVLNIVGASHKPYYDLYLSQMADAVVVDAGAVLGAN